ncbi:MAG: glycosyltransferase, partial [Bacteroidetes bacterium]
EELAAQGVEQWVYCPRGAPLGRRAAAAGLPVQSYRRSFAWNPLTARRLMKFCERQGITLIHAHDAHAHTLACLAASLWGEAALIVVSRRVDFPLRSNPFTRWKYNHRRVRRILCVSRFIEALVRPHLEEPLRTRVVYSGVDLGRFPETPNGSLRQALQVETDLPLVANVAALAPHKDYPTFLRAARAFLDRGHRACFLIIGGDAGEEKRVRREVKELGLEGTVHLLGFRTDVPALLPQLDALLVSSKTEGLNTTILDAFACRVPVVATRAGGIPELVEHETTGLLAPVEDPNALAAQLERLFQEPQLRDRLIANAHQKVQAFSRQALGRQSLEVYREILEAELGIVVKL